MSKPDALQFGSFTFRSQPPTLLKGEIRQHLQPRALEVLRVLIEGAPNTVTRQDILEDVWGLESEVEDGNIDTHVKEIRRVIGDTYIEVVPKIGYRFTVKCLPVTGALTAILGDSDAIVVRAVTAGWGLDKIFEQHGYGLSHRVRPWGDGILRSIDEAQIDFAIYNDRRSEHYINSNPHTNVIRLTEYFASMQGRNFYVLAQKGTRWKEPFKTAAELRENLKQYGGTFAFRRDTGMPEKFLMVLSCNKEDLPDVRFIEVEHSDGLSHFAHDSDLLLAHGQNVRFQAKYRQVKNDAPFMELIDYDAAGPAQQRELERRSVNCVVAHKDFVEDFGRQELIDAIREGYRNFEKAWESPTERTRLEEELMEIPFAYGTQELGEARYIVHELVRLSHGFPLR